VKATGFSKKDLNLKPETYCAMAVRVEVLSAPAQGLVEMGRDGGDMSA
jgi:hypothetical protein